MTETAGATGGRTSHGLGGWLAGRTLRGRLIAGLVALLALACALVGLSTYVALRGFLYHQLSTQLTAASTRYVDCVTSGHPPPADQGDHGPAGCLRARFLAAARSAARRPGRSAPGWSATP